MLFDGTKRFLTGQEHRTHTRRRFFRPNQAWFLKFNLQNSVTLIKFWRPREVAEGQKNTGYDAKHHNPDPFDNGMPETEKIQTALLLEKIDIRRNWRHCDGGRRRQWRNR